MVDQTYPHHQCDNVFPPSMTELPPDLHKPTPAPHKSIFHEMMVSNWPHTACTFTLDVIVSGR